MATLTRTVDGVPVRLADGGTATLRLLKHGETGPILEVFAGMSDLSRARRYLTGMARLPAVMLAALADVDGCHHVAWVASIDGHAVGIGRYVHTDPVTVEVAFEVVDAHHGRGLGWVLADTLATLASAHGITRITASAAPDNGASLRVLRGLGLSMHLDDGLLEGTGRLRLPEPARVPRSAVLALARRETRRPATSCA
jgi:RimJ/RimL family protein N-acetyltransferase